MLTIKMVEKDVLGFNGLHVSNLYWSLFFSLVTMAAIIIAMYTISDDFRRPSLRFRYITSWDSKNNVLSWGHTNGVVRTNDTNNTLKWVSLDTSRPYFLHIHNDMMSDSGYTSPILYSANNDDYALLAVVGTTNHVVSCFKDGASFKAVNFAGSVKSITFPLQYGMWNNEVTFGILNNESSIQLLQESDNFETVHHTLDAIKSTDETVLDYTLTESDIWVSVTTPTRSILRIYSGKDKILFKSWSESHTKGLWAITRKDRAVMFHPNNHSVSYHVKGKGWNIVSQLSWVRDPGNQSLLSTPCAGSDIEMNVVCFLTVNSAGDDGFAFWIHLTPTGFKAIYEIRLGYVPVLRPHVTKVGNVYYTFINETSDTTHVYRSYV